MPSTNIKMLQTVAKGLGDLKEEMVFVGGAVAELYASNPELSDIRTTIDVDCVIEIRSKTAQAKLEEDLRAKGFANDISKDAPICRWVYKDVLVDIMPSDSDVLGFSNRWYDEGIENKVSKTLPNRTEIFVFSADYYLAAKFEAHKGRGGEDLRQSHDFEDIICILDDCAELLESINNANDVVYIGAMYRDFVNKENNTGSLGVPELDEGVLKALDGFTAINDLLIEKWENVPDITPGKDEKLAELYARVERLTYAKDRVENSNAINYDIKKEIVNNWSTQIGFNFEISDHWMYRGELGYRDDQKFFMTGLQFRFGF